MSVSTRLLLSLRRLVILFALILLVAAGIITGHMADVITAVTFIVVLGVLVLVHELGHFLTARLFKVRVEEFGLGFPPRVYPSREVVEQRRKWGQTVYSLNALPLGGFVRLAGENGVTTLAAHEPAQDSGALALGGTAVSPDDPGAFSNKPAWQRAIILIAGAFNNMVLAMLLVFFIFAGIGTPHVTTEVAGVARYSPADTAHIMPGDIIQRVDGQVPQDQTDVRDLIAARSGRRVSLQLLRNGKVLTVQVVPRVRAPCDQGAVGVVTDAVNERYVPTSLGRAASAAINLPGTVVQGLVALVGGLGTAPPPLPAACGYTSQYVTFGGLITAEPNVRSVPGAVQEDKCLAVSGTGSGITGPIGIIRQVGCEANSIPTQGWVPLLTLVVELSATLAIINLLPIPALDGGRLLFVLISVVARRRIRPEVEGMAHALGMFALLVLMFFVSWNDLSNLINNRPAF